MSAARREKTSTIRWLRFEQEPRGTSACATLSPLSSTRPLAGVSRRLLKRCEISPQSAKTAWLDFPSFTDGADNHDHDAVSVRFRCLRADGSSDAVAFAVGDLVHLDERRDAPRSKWFSRSQKAIPWRVPMETSTARTAPLIVKAYRRNRNSDTWRGACVRFQVLDATPAVVKLEVAVGAAGKADAETHTFLVGGASLAEATAAVSTAATYAAETAPSSSAVSTGDSAATLTLEDVEALLDSRAAHERALAFPAPPVYGNAEATPYPPPSVAWLAVPEENRARRQWLMHWPHEVDAADEVAKTPVQREEVVSGDVAMAECAGLDGLPPVLDESSPLSTYSAASQGAMIALDLPPSWGSSEGDALTESQLWSMGSTNNDAVVSTASIVGEAGSRPRKRKRRHDSLDTAAMFAATLGVGEGGGVGGSNVSTEIAWGSSGPWDGYALMSSPDPTLVPVCLQGPEMVFPLEFELSFSPACANDPTVPDPTSAAAVVTVAVGPEGVAAVPPFASLFPLGAGRLDPVVGLDQRVFMVGEATVVATDRDHRLLASGTFRYFETDDDAAAWHASSTAWAAVDLMPGSGGGGAGGQAWSLAGAVVR